MVFSVYYIHTETFIIPCHSCEESSFAACDWTFAASHWLEPLRTKLYNMAFFFMSISMYIIRWGAAQTWEWKRKTWKMRMEKMARYDKKKWEGKWKYETTNLSWPGGFTRHFGPNKLMWEFLAYIGNNRQVQNQLVKVFVEVKKNSRVS